MQKDTQNSIYTLLAILCTIAIGIFGYAKREDLYTKIDTYENLTKEFDAAYAMTVRNRETKRKEEENRILQEQIIKQQLIEQQKNAEMIASQKAAYEAEQARLFLEQQIQQQLAAEEAARIAAEQAAAEAVAQKKSRRSRAS